MRLLQQADMAKVNDTDPLDNIGDLIKDCCLLGHLLLYGK